MNAVLWQRIEGGLVLLAAFWMVFFTGMFAEVGPWYWLVILFLAPDLGLLGYGLGPRAGAFIYNALHLYAGGLVLMAAGYLSYDASGLPVMGLLWVAHVGFDRMLGYGLKLPSGFHDTHLGRIGRPGA